MKVSVFNQREPSHTFYSPDFYFNDLNFMLYPNKHVLILLCNTSAHAHQSDQNQIIFAKRHLFYKDQTYKLIVHVKNTCQDRIILCRKKTSLSKLLTIPGISHSYTHVSKKDFDRLLSKKQK
jgi:hypothetical protein